LKNIVLALDTMDDEIAKENDEIAKEYRNTVVIRTEKILSSELSQQLYQQRKDIVLGMMDDKIE
jgi:hypothetical protein